MDTSTQTSGSVVVGVDGSAHNASAVAWAAAEALSSGRPLVLRHAAASPSSHRDGAGRAVVDRAEALVQDRVGTAVVTERELVDGSTVPALAGTAEPGLLVVGRRGSGGFGGLSLGSTARTLALEDGPDVVVVPGGWEPTDATGQVVVLLGADVDDVGHEGGLAFALPWAERHGHRVLALSTWSVPAAAATQGRAIAEVWQEHAEAARVQMEALLARWRARYPEVELSGSSVDQHPVAAALEAAQRDGDGVLLVVVRGEQAGSLLEHARCPVAVVARTGEAGEVPTLGLAVDGGVGPDEEPVPLVALAPSA